MRLKYYLAVAVFMLVSVVMTLFGVFVGLFFMGVPFMGVFSLMAMACSHS